jgi:integrase
MPKGRITKRAVDALTCPSGKDRAFLWDTSLAGFGVCVFPGRSEESGRGEGDGKATGKKVYVAQYRKDGRSRRVAIGEHGRLTPDEARAEAKKLLGAVETGADPADERRTAREVRTFRAVAEDWLRLHVRAKRGARTAEEYERIMKLHILPHVGSKRIVDLRRADLTKLHAAMSETPRAANHALSVISAVWNWSARRDEVAAAANPAKGIERYAEDGRERYLTTAELARLGDALREGETIGLPFVIDETKPKAKHAPKPEHRRVKLDPFGVAAIRLLLLTGARLREILDARWSQVDLERGVLFLTQSKTGRKPLYLSAAAQAVLAEIPRIEGNPYIITGAKEGAPRADLKGPWERVRRAAGLEDVRIHDLRHSFASFGAGASFGLPIIGKLLGHTQAATTQRYAHLDADPLRRAADAIGATIAAAMDGPARPDNVRSPRAGKRCD